jgi:PAS domain S-box-containing protein
VSVDAAQRGATFLRRGRTTRQVDADGRCIGFTKVLRDETLRVVAESARRAEEARFRTLVQNLHDYAIFMLDANGRITEWTEGAARVSGFKADEVLGRHLEIFYTLEERAAQVPDRELAEATLRGRVEREGWRVIRGGNRIWVNEIATAIYDSEERVPGFTKISRLVDDLLDVARISTGKVELRKAAVSLRRVLTASIEVTHALVESRRHELLLDPGTEELFVYGDFHRLAQVFANLISNGAKYMDPGGRIHVTLRREDQHAVVVVADMGIGIPSTDLSRVFGMFTQIQPNRDRAQGGLGIGLSLVKNLVELHEGTVTTQSAGLGLGSEFTVAQVVGNERRSIGSIESPMRSIGICRRSRSVR